MNINGVARGYLSKLKNTEHFVMHVANTVERQLREWDDGYDVLVLRLESYVWIVEHNRTIYQLPITDNEAQQLQQKSPYALDTHIWRELAAQGLPIIRGKGNYIDYVLRK